MCDGNKKEHRAIMKRMDIVSVIVALIAISSFGVVFFVARSNEEDEAVKQFLDYAKDLGESTEATLKNSQSITTSLSSSLTSFASSNDAKWPLVTLADFAERNEPLRTISKAEYFIFAPFVKKSELDTWETYSEDNSHWIVESYKYEGIDAVFDSSSILPIHSFSEADASSTEMYFPVWQVTKVPSNLASINTDLGTNSAFNGAAFHGGFPTAVPTVSKMTSLQGSFGDKQEEPVFLLLDPVFVDIQKTSVVGYYLGVFKWTRVLESVLPESGLVDVVIQNNVGQVFSYRIDCDGVVFIGEGETNKNRYSGMSYTVSLGDIFLGGEACVYELTIFPTTEFESLYQTSQPLLYGLIAAAGVLLSLILFLAMFRRTEVEVHDKVAPAQAPELAEAVINAALPSEIVERLAELSESVEDSVDPSLIKTSGLNKAELKNFLNEGVLDNFRAPSADSKPIADLFPETTVLFADIAGFTAWSSVREPSQVFTLLETVYHSFDEIARKHGVFKVETVGDCYVAVTGLPEPRPDHAVAMATFARECVTKMIEMVNKLEVSLGPDTADLAIRVGMHSGPVTAGVLRGERARFQLFGDTMNTAARMEHTGVRKKIHVSQETADLLVADGKKEWLKLREDVIVAKGKGALETFWVITNEELLEKEQEADKEAAAKATAKAANSSGAKNQKVQRLIDWNCELLVQLLKKVVMRRKVCKTGRDPDSKLKTIESQFSESHNVLDEVVEIIKLPKFQDAGDNHTDLKKVDLGDEVNDQLREYVSILASMYRDNAFHCYEHASHVTMSVSKLLARIVAPDNVEGDGCTLASALHDHTYGITSDPLTQFSVVLSALIHDVDHRGVPNFVLCKEDPHLASAYNSKSVAEQNSVDIAWQSLMDERFRDFRACIYGNESELRRFRQLIVNSVMATDIFDKELTAARKERWNKAFNNVEGLDESPEDTINRKATIVIEHLIQASDVSHTMQHWHVYTKWNKRLFEEMYCSYRNGRWDTNPSVNWYKGEIGFFEGYVIPLATKLKQCGVFGVSSDEYLNYAKKNLDEWRKRGEDVVETMVDQMKEKFDDLKEE